MEAQLDRSPRRRGSRSWGSWLWILAAAALAAAGVAALQSCGDYSLYTALEVEESAPALELSAGDAVLAVPLTVPLTLSVTGGVPPFEPSLKGPGTLTADTEVPDNSLLIYRAPDTMPGEETTAIIEVRDFVGKRVSGRIRVHRPLSVDPGLSFWIHRDAEQELTVSGGIRPYDVSATYGSISTGANDRSYWYACPATGMSDEVQIRDAVGNLRIVAVLIVEPSGGLSLDPPAAVIGLGESTSFVVSGGTPDYSYVKTSGDGVITWDGTAEGSTVTYTAPDSPEVASVRVTDAASPPASANFTVGVVPPLAATFDGNPSSDKPIKVNSGQTIVVAVSGGRGPYDVTVRNSSLQTPGSISRAQPGTWTYVAPPVGHAEHETIVVTDYGGSTVYQPLQIKP